MLYVIVFTHGLQILFNAFYLNALVDTRVFFKKEMVPEKLGKNRLEEIIQKEMDHIRLIGRKLPTLKP